LNRVAATTELARPIELIVHALERRLIEASVLRPQDKGAHRVEGQDDRLAIHLRVENGNFSAVVSKLLSVDLEGQAALDRISTRFEQQGEHFGVRILARIHCAVMGQQAVEVRGIALQ